MNMRDRETMPQLGFTLPTVEEVERMAEQINKENEPEEEDDESQEDDSMDLFSGFLRERPSDIASRRRERRRQRRKVAGTGRLEYSQKLEKLMGEATSLYISKNFSESAQLLLEVIRQEPRIATAYETLGLVYEAIGDMKQSLNVMLLAAHLCRNNPHKWKQVVDQAEHLSEWDIVIYALSRLCRNEKELVWALYKRASIHKKLGNWKKAICDLQLLCSKTPLDPKILKECCDLLCVHNQKQAAIRILENYFILTRRKIDPSLTAETVYFDIDLAQLLLKLQLESELFEEAVEFFNLLKTIMDLNEIPLEVFVIYGICQLHLDNCTEADFMFQKLYCRDAAIYHDLYMEVIDAYIAVGLEESAMIGLENLSKNTEFLDHRLWYRLALCKKSIGNILEALEYAEKAVFENPDSSEYRLLLSCIYQETGDSLRALRVIHPESSNDDALSFPSLNSVLKTDHQKYIESSTENSSDANFPKRLALGAHKSGTESEGEIKEDQSLLLSDSKRKFEGKGKSTRAKTKLKWKSMRSIEIDVNQIKLLSQAVKIYQENENFEEIISLLLNPIYETMSYYFVRLDEIKSISAEKHGKVPAHNFRALIDPEFLGLALLLCKSLALFERNEEGIEICDMIHQLDYHVLDEVLKESCVPKSREFHLLNIGMHYNCKDYEGALALMRPLVLEDSYDLSMMNLVGECLYFLHYPARYRRYVYRLNKKFPDSVPILMMNGHSAFVKRSFLQALRFYMSALQLSPHDPLIHFMIGISSLLRANNKFIRHRHQYVMQGYACLFKYAQLRLESSSGSDFYMFAEPEVCYNLGLAFQSMKLYHFAIPYYEQVLSMGRSLVHESAHNLSVLYRHGGQEYLARQVINRYNIF
jgi:general transcription factor 3C polypeptide 3 (transcription factor C subunit 4)